MTIRSAIPFTISPGLERELAHLSNESDIIYDSIEQLKETTERSIYRATVDALLSRLSEKSKVVDLGCGFGETSLLLAAAGHDVHSIEPAFNRCKALSQSFANLKLTGSIYVCTAESLDKISFKGLDGALFYSSLHHCDDPLQVLKHIKASLGPKGIVVINEPVLKFYRSKQWFHRQLEKNPIKMGHYGGNEHIYFFKEYYNMLRSAGFQRVEFDWAQKDVDPRKTFIADLNSTLQGYPQHSVIRCFIKYCLHSLIKRISKHKWLHRLCVRPLLKLSFLQPFFIAYVS